MNSLRKSSFVVPLYSIREQPDAATSNNPENLNSLKGRMRILSLSRQPRAAPDDTETKKIPPIISSAHAVSICNNLSDNTQSNRPAESKQLHHAFLTSEIGKVATKPLVIKYTDEELSEISGIPKKWISLLKRFVKNKECAYGFRPISRWATKKMEAGFPTKNFDIKGKSSDENGMRGWIGAIHGWIPVDQSFSKVEDHEEAEKFSTKIKEIIDNKHVEARGLIIPKWLIEDLKAKGAEVEKLDSGDLYLSPPKGIKGIILTAVPVLDEKEIAPFVDGSIHDPNNGKPLTRKHGFYRIYYKEKPFQVLCDPQCHLPITADIDPDDLIIPIEKYGPDDIPPNPDVTQDHFKARRKYSLPENLDLSLAGFDKREIPGKGNIPRRVEIFNDELNKVLGREKRPVIHHNVDALSPVSDMTSNFPTTYFLPPKLSSTFGPVHVIRDYHERVDFTQKVLDMYYHANRNPASGPEFPKLRRKSFTEAIRIWSQESNQNSQK